MSNTDSFMRNDKENVFPCFQNLLFAFENKEKTFANIIQDLKKFVYTSYSINIFNYSIESKIFLLKDNNEEVYDIYRALKYYIKINSANFNYLLRKTEIINRLLIKLINEITSQEELIFEGEKNTKKYKKIIKFFYNLYVILIKLKDSISYEDKFLLKSVRQIGNFLTNLNSFRDDFSEKNIKTFFIDLIYLCISQISPPNSKSSGSFYDEMKINIRNDAEKNEKLITQNQMINENLNLNTNNVIQIENFVEFNKDINEEKNIKNDIINDRVKTQNIYLDKFENKYNVNDMKYNLQHSTNTENRILNDLITIEIENNQNLNFKKNLENINLIDNSKKNTENIIKQRSDLNNYANYNKNKQINLENLNNDLNSVPYVNPNHIPLQNISNNESNFTKYQPQEISHTQNIQTKSSNSLIQENPSIKKELKSNTNLSEMKNSEFKMYEAKLKHFTKIYFSKEEFIRDLKTTKSKDLNEYYNSLECIIYNFYLNHHESYNKCIKLDEENLKNTIKKLFPKCRAKIIGSYNLKYLRNLKENDGVVDCLVNLIDDNKSIKGSNDSNLKNFLTIPFDKNSVIKNLDNFENEYFRIYVKSSQFSEFKCFNTLKILVESKKLDNNCLVDLLFFNELYYYSNFLLEKIFLINTKTPQCDSNLDFNKFNKLHLFFQEILLKNVQVICFTRFQLSLLIIAFLDLEYGIFNKNEKNLINLESIYLPDIDPDNPKEENTFKLKTADYYMYKLNKTNFNRVLENVRLGELIDGFFRYILSYLTFFKNLHFEKGNSRRDFVDGYDILCKYFKRESQPHLHDEKYVFNHIEITTPLSNLNQGVYNNRFVKFFKSLSNIYFKILENFKSIKNYAEIIFNIEKYVKI